MNEHIKKAARKFVEGFAGGRIDRATLAKGWTCRNAALGEISGDGYLDGIEKASQVLPDMVVIIDRVIAEENCVVVQARSKATLPTGGVYENQYCLVFEFHVGLISRIYSYLDTQKANRDLLPFVKARG